MPSDSIPIKVVAKCRPLLEEERQKGSKSVVKISGDRVSIEANGKEQSFVFDYAYGAEAKANQMFNDFGGSLVQRAMNGNNVTIMTMGAMGTGKSYMMAGRDEDPGIIPCFNRSLFQNIDGSDKNKRFFITVSFIEIIDEKLMDMLNPHNRDIMVREHPTLGIFVEGLSELVVNSGEDLIRLFEQGDRARKMGASDIRAHRARSHGIFTITMHQKETASSKIGVRSKITLADLAGQDPSCKNQEGNISAKAMEEVLQALKSGGNIPYRNSKVSRILQPSLGGNAATVILAQISPSDKNYQETIKTLQTTASARSLKNQVAINLDETDSIIRDLRGEISHLREKITKNPDARKEEIVKMEDLVQDLQIAKRQTWEEKKRLSAQYEEERKTNLANKGILEWVMDTAQKGNKEVQERVLLLQKEKDQLTAEYKDKRKKVDEMKEDLQKQLAEYSKLTESGKTNEGETKKRVGAIHQLKEKLTKETEDLKSIKNRLREVQDSQKAEREISSGQTFMKGNAELRQMVEAEERRRMAQHHKTLEAEALERMELEKELEKGEIQMKVKQGHEYSQEEGSRLEMDLVDIKSDRYIVCMKLEYLQKEKELLEKDLDAVHQRHKEELEIQQLQHFETFRQYREMFEKQKAVFEERYRGLLEDAVRDAIYFSSRNSELMRENKEQAQEIAALKDRLSMTGGN